MNFRTCSKRCPSAYLLPFFPSITITKRQLMEKANQQLAAIGRPIFGSWGGFKAFNLSTIQPIKLVTEVILAEHYALDHALANAVIKMPKDWQGELWIAHQAPDSFYRHTLIPYDVLHLGADQIKRLKTEDSMRQVTTRRLNSPSKTHGNPFLPQGNELGRGYLKAGIEMTFKTAIRFFCKR